ncbi:MAG TPA: DNA-3-methyladenine glycosylase [Mariniphaga sp.]|nr:DNA-3-methyladenine glycosylase [Mariniphaga sp.]
MNSRLTHEFFRRDVLTVAPELLGKILVRKFSSSDEKRYIITEVEAYSAPHDLACHASKGRTARTEVMFRDGGLVYVYLIYGIFWMLNIVTGREGEASAVLIRGIQETSGPGRVGKLLQLDKSFYGEDLYVSDRLWIEDSSLTLPYKSLPRVGIDYAGEPWISIPWRYLAEL